MAKVAIVDGIGNDSMGKVAFEMANVLNKSNFDTYRMDSSKKAPRKLSDILFQINEDPTD